MVKNKKKVYSVMANEGFGECLITIHETTYIVPAKKAGSVSKMRKIMNAIRSGDVDYLRRNHINFVTRG